MTVGESLTQARYQAGLTIDELSERTRIRASVIRSIEADDYEACGGDLYVRGYVRAIAGRDRRRRPGADPRVRPGAGARGPRCRRHHLRPARGARVRPPRPTSAGSAGPRGPTAPDGPEACRRSDAVRPGGQDPDETRFDLPPVREDFAATRFDIPPVRADQAEDLMAAGYEVQPAAGGAGAGLGTPAGSARPRRPPRRRRPRAPAVGAGRRRLLAGVVRRGRAGAGRRGRRPPGVRVDDTARTRPTRLRRRPARLPRAGTSASPATSAAADTKPAATPTATPSATPAVDQPAAVSPPVTLLPLAAAEAFGPGGLGDGDNPSGRPLRDRQQPAAAVVDQLVRHRAVRDAQAAGPACCSASATRPRSPACAST